MKKLIEHCKKKISAYNIEFTPSFVFCFFGILSMCFLFFCFLFSRGLLISHYFFQDVNDTGMDFFHSIEYVRDRAPYEQFNALYPPLANLFFLVLYLFIPERVSSAWPSDFWDSVAMRGTELDLRTHQAPMLLFLLFSVICCWITATLIGSFLKRYSCKHANCVAFCIMFSPGMLYALERGNILLLTVPLLLFYVFFYKSENRVIRESALICLAFAAGLKLYPAFFGILLIREKRFKEAVRAVLYGIISVLFPLIFFKEGLTGIPMWLKAVFAFDGNISEPWLGTSFAGILHRAAHYADVFLHIKVNTDWFPVLGILFSALLLVSALFCKKEWQRVLAATMAIIMFQSQAGYVFSLLGISLVVFLTEEKSFSKENKLPFVLMALLTIHVPLFYTSIWHPDIVFKQLISLMLAIWCITNAATEGINYIKSRSK